jgi:ribosomal protein S27AE
MILKGRHKYWGKIDRTGIKRPTGTCNRCGVTMAVNAIGKYHNDKCKINPL